MECFDWQADWDILQLAISRSWRTLRRRGAEEEGQWREGKFGRETERERGVMPILTILNLINQRAFFRLNLVFVCILISWDFWRHIYCKHLCIEISVAYKEVFMLFREVQTYLLFNLSVIKQNSSEVRFGGRCALKEGLEFAFILLIWCSFKFNTRY